MRSIEDAGSSRREMLLWSVDRGIDGGFLAFAGYGML